MKWKILRTAEDIIIDDASTPEQALEEFININRGIEKYFYAVPLDPARKCSNCRNRFYESMFGKEPCGAYEMATTEDEAAACGRYEREEEYCPSSSAGDYSPSNPWDAPGMSVRDFI